MLLRLQCGGRDGCRRASARWKLHCESLGLWNIQIGTENRLTMDSWRWSGIASALLRRNDSFSGRCRPSARRTRASVSNDSSRHFLLSSVSGSAENPPRCIRNCNSLVVRNSHACRVSRRGTCQTQLVRDVDNPDRGLSDSPTASLRYRPQH